MKSLFIFFAILLLSCGRANNLVNKEQDVENVTKSNQVQPTEGLEKNKREALSINEVQEPKEINIQNLYKAMEDKDAQEFLRQFPKDFEQFQHYFGWNVHDDAPHELYENSVHYIEYLFYLLRTNKYPEYENNILSICENGHWEADGINYFQHHVRKYIKETERYSLINDLSDERTKSVLFFLFDGPHPEFDADFASHLSSSKKEILEELFEIGFYDDNENPDLFPDEETNVTYTLSDYVENEHFFIRDIDINNDGTPDKIISAEKYQGDELFLFLKKGNEYQFTLKTTNFSEDGGNQIVDVIADEGGFVVKTAFMDGGLLEADYHIAFKNNAWVLTHTVYSTQSSNQEDAFIYVCNVVQELNLEDADFFESLKGMPDETQRERLCTKEKMN